jgi:hypothetical protein
MAFRLGQVVVCYEGCVQSGQQDYSATLHICALQFLLTYCSELLNAMQKADKLRLIFDESLGEVDTMGLRLKLVKENTFQEKLTLGSTLRHLRNSLSHPGKLDPKLELPTTGYTTILDGTNIINKFCFVDSPDMFPTGIRTFRSQVDAERFISRERNFPYDVRIVRDAVRWRIEKDGKEFGRIFRMELEVGALRKLVSELSNILAQPTKKDWDGQTISNLVA